MNATNNAKESTMESIHVFEKAGLGKAPFRYVGCERKTFQAAPDAPVQCGGACQFCGHEISMFCYIVSADGKRFHVGSDCVAKTGDAGLKSQVNRDKRKLQIAREEDRIEAARKALVENSELLAALSDTPDPSRHGFNANAREWCSWMIHNAGHKGRMDAVRYLKKVHGLKV
jgi:hypothetical protein